MTYDPNNVFAKILRGELPCNKAYEDATVLAFYDIAPQAPVHVLVVPKAEYVSYDDFLSRATALEVKQFFAAVRLVAEMQGLSETGYRLITNHRAEAGQSVFHFHVHILGGKPLGALLP